jgi:hypothetical protein
LSRIPAGGQDLTLLDSKENWFYGHASKLHFSSEVKEAKTRSLEESDLNIQADLSGAAS